MRWYVLYTPTQREAKLRRWVLAWVRSEGLEAKLGAFLIPRVKVAVPSMGRPRIFQQSAFPGYFYMQLEPSLLRPLHRFMAQQNVGLCLLSKKPRPQSEIDALQQLNQAKPLPLRVYKSGERVRVVDGPFAGFQVLVQEVNPSAQTLRASFELFGRTMTLEFHFKILGPLT